MAGAVTARFIVSHFKSRKKGAIILRYLKTSLFIAVFALCMAHVCSQDDNSISGAGGYLDTGDNSARQEIQAAFGEEDLFNPGKSSSAIGTDKNAPVVVTRDMLPSAEESSDTLSIPAGVAGKWSLALTGGTAKSVTLMLAQSDDAIFGRGYMICGNSTQDVTATGTISGSQINLDMLALSDMNLYRLELGIVDNLMSGEYTVYSASVAPISGDADGNIA